MFDGPAPFKDLKDLMLDLTLSSVKKLAPGSVISTVSARGTLSFEEGSAVDFGKCVSTIISADCFGVHLVPSAFVKVPRDAEFSLPNRFLSFAVSSVSITFAMKRRQNLLFTLRQ